MTTQTIPRINLWKPDPNILLELEYLIKSELVIENYSRLMDESRDAAENYVRLLISDQLQIDNPTDIEQYSMIVSENIRVEREIGDDSSHG